MLEGQPNKPDEIPRPSLADTLQPGSVIEIANMFELAAFEDLVASDIDPTYDPVMWATRIALKDLIRPPKFYGTIEDIKLEVMAEPYERLQDAKKRGWQLGPGNFGRKSENDKDAGQHYHGFVLTGTPKSSRPGQLGQIQAELWYYPPLSVYRIEEGQVRKEWYRLSSDRKIYREYLAKKESVSVQRSKY